MLEVSAVPSAEIRRKFSVGQAKFDIGASLKVSAKKLLWNIRLTWLSIENDMVRSRLRKDVMTLEYLRRWALMKNCNAVASSSVNMASKDTQRSHNGDENSGSLKINCCWGSRAQREEPSQSSAYLKGSEQFGRNRLITVVPGHFIDAGKESGAPGEREFNLEIANLVEKNLHACGWKVLRPDRDAPHLSWEEYLNWVSKQTLCGRSVVEIHGQGSAAAFRGNVIGVIGDPSMTLTKELSKAFGFFELGWRNLGVPCRGGVIVESFNSDEVLRMAPWQQVQASKHISTKFVESIQRASSRNESEGQ